MATIGLRRVALGTLAGGVVWGIWSTIINMVILMPRYQFAQAHQVLLPQPRYPLFVVYWFVTLFLLTYILTWAYVSVRTTFGPGPITALRVGLLIGFVMSFPLSLSHGGLGALSAAPSCWGGCLTFGWARSWQRWSPPGCIKKL